MMTTNGKKKHSSSVKRGLAITAAISAAAGLASAALLYLQRQGVEPETALGKLRRGARSAGGILGGQTRAAYDEVRKAIAADLAKSQKRVTKQVVADGVAAVVATLKKRGALTSKEMHLLAHQLRADLQNDTKAASRSSKS